MRRSLVASYLVAVAAVAIVDAGVKVKTEYDRSADFSGLRSYAWLPTPPYRTQTTPEARDEFLSASEIDAPLKAAVDRVLAAKGLKPAADGSAPDCYLVYYAAFGVNINANVLGEHYAYITGWGSPQVGGTPTTTLRVIEHGSVVLDMLSHDRKVAIWRGTATGSVDRDQTPQERRRRINETVDDLFKKFPPGR